MPKELEELLRRLSDLIAQIPRVAPPDPPDDEACFTLVDRRLLDEAWKKQPADLQKELVVAWDSLGQCMRSQNRVHAWAQVLYGQILHRVGMLYPESARPAELPKDDKGGKVIFRWPPARFRPDDEAGQVLYPRPEASSEAPSDLEITQELEPVSGMPSDEDDEDLKLIVQELIQVLVDFAKSPENVARRRQMEIVKALAELPDHSGSATDADLEELSRLRRAAVLQLKDAHDAREAGRTEYAAGIDDALSSIFAGSHLARQQKQDESAVQQSEEPEPTESSSAWRLRVAAAAAAVALAGLLLLFFVRGDVQPVPQGHDDAPTLATPVEQPEYEPDTATTLRGDPSVPAVAPADLPSPAEQPEPEIAGASRPGRPIASRHTSKKPEPKPSPSQSLPSEPAIIEDDGDSQQATNLDVGDVVIVTRPGPLPNLRISIEPAPPRENPVKSRRHLINEVDILRDAPARFAIGDEDKDRELIIAVEAK